MKEKNRNVLATIFLVILLLVVSGLGGYYLGNTKVRDNKNEEVSDTCEKCPEVKCNEDEKKCVCPTCDKDSITTKMHVFTYANDFKGYDIYSYLHNQGWDLQVIDWNGELLLIEEGDSKNSSCIYRLVDGDVKYEKKENGRTYYECENDYTENTSGEIIKLNVKTSEVSTVKIINSCMSDGSPYIYVVGKDGTVSEIETREGTFSKKTMFREYKVKDITDFRCEDQQEAGYKTSVYTLLLEDGTTKEIKN